MNLNKFTYGKYSYQYYLVFQNRKTLTLAVQPSLNIILKCPTGCESDKIERFLKRKWLWLEKQIQYFKKYNKQKAEKEYISGESFLYLGRQYKLLVKSSQQESVKLDHGKIIIFTSKSTQNTDTNKMIIEKWLTERTKIIFESRLKQMLKKFDYDLAPSLTIRKMQKRWGSYLSNKKIILNPLLIKASKDCIDYVITHELCHLKHKNHDKKFFKLQESIIPNWKEVKEKLELRFL